MATKLCPVLRHTQNSEARGEEAAAEEKQWAEERVCSPGGRGQKTKQDTSTMHGHEGDAAGAAEGHSGISWPHQIPHQSHPARAGCSGHHDDHHHHQRLPVVPGMDETYQHQPFGHTQSEEPRTESGQQLAHTEELLSSWNPHFEFFSKRRKTHGSVWIWSIFETVTYSAYEISFLSYFLFINVLGLIVFNTRR